MSNGKHPSLLILPALLAGLEIEKQGNRYCLCDERYLCMVAHSENTVTKQMREVLLKVSFGSVTLPEFLAWCEDFTPDELILISANKVLTEVNQRKTR